MLRPPSSPAGAPPRIGLEELAAGLGPEGRRRRRRRLLRRLPGHALARTCAGGAKRAFDLTAAGLGLLLGTPFFLLAWGNHRLGGGPLLRREVFLGRYGHPFDRLSFGCTRGPLGFLFRLPGLRALPRLENVLRGHMSLVGPRPLRPGELDVRRARSRGGVRPGLIGLWWVRSRTSTLFEPEVAVDAEYRDRAGLKTDLGILLQAAPAALYGRNGTTACEDRIRILDLPIDNVTLEQAVSDLLEGMETGRRTRVCFVNADCGNIACRDPRYRRAVQEADRVYADGIGFQLAGRILKRPVRQNVNGTDMFPRLCEAMAEAGRSLFLLGARPGVAEAVADWVRREHPGVRIAGVQHGYYPPEETGEVLERIRSSRPDLLLVAFGAPRQELWLQEHLEASGATVGIGVGGLFDFYSGRTRRAPRWMRDIGLEWFYRFLQEPGRMWKRYFVGNFTFLARVLRERWTGRPPVRQEPSS